MVRNIRNKRRNKLGRRLIHVSVFVLLVFSLVLISSDAWIEYSAEGRTFDTVNEVPKNRVGLVLGTSKWSRQGQNLFYKARIEAAVSLYFAQKVDYLLISGDNGTKYYNEPQTIKDDLISRGIPKERIFLDFAGFRTLDSVVRAKEVFQLAEFTVISQQFHNERALFIARAKGIEAIAFNAEDVGGDRGLGIKIRERLARLNMMLDLLIGTEPRFLGEQIEIG